MTFLLVDREAVRQGALFLDVEREGWEREIDQDSLDMCYEHGCILGQLYGDYEYGLADLGIGDAEDLGFYLAGTLTWSSPEEDARWARLTELWITEIRNRTGE
jgi:hypothetical protein